MTIGHTYVATMKPLYYTIFDEHIIVTGKIIWEQKPLVSPLNTLIYVDQSRELNGMR